DWQSQYEAEIARIEAEMQAVSPQSGISIEKVFSVPGLVPETDGAAETLVRTLTGDNARHVVSYGTEAGHYQVAGYSAVVCGP
ncbi:acetylornithine deacetylase, partial [Rhizobium sp. SIMBA_035]